MMFEIEVAAVVLAVGWATDRVAKRRGWSWKKDALVGMATSVGSAVTFALIYIWATGETIGMVR